VRRREFIALLGGAAAWPLAAVAQQGTHIRRVGVLMSVAEDDPEGAVRLTVFQGSLEELGWRAGHNVQIDTHWGAATIGDNRKHAAELVALAPDVILASTTVALAPLLELTRTVPIVFVNAADPVGAGFVESLARPGGNATGFIVFEYSLSAKWLELLKEIAPRTTRVAVLRDASVPAGIGQFSAIQAVAPTFGVELHPVNLRDAGEIERAIDTFAEGVNGGLIVTASTLATKHRKLIIELAARHRLPAIYPFAYYAGDDGLLAYGPNSIDQYRRAAAYIDRILKGEKPADLPVQAPTKYELVINLKTAKALGIDMPATLLARADEVIE
jgi:putative ABC transport system substrate-binding protein